MMNELIESTLRNAGIPIVLVDRESNILKINGHFEALTGFQSDFLINRSLEDLLTPDPWDLFNLEEETPGKTVDRSCVLKTAENRAVPVRIEEIPLTGDGEKTKLLFIFDCSEMRERLSDNTHVARLAMLGKLLSGVVHEISNPLSIICGRAQLLALKDLPPEISSEIQHIYSESVRTSDIIKKVLTFARKREENKEVFPLQNVIEEAAILKRYSLKANKIKLEYTPQFKKPLLVRGYKAQLMQVVLNLINNSEQAISIEKGDGTIGIRANQRGERAVVTISDSGPGIDPQARTRIFDAFYTTKDKSSGTGMGLYLSRSIIQRHGGDLNLVGSDAGNTVFQIMLPLSKEAPSIRSETGAAGVT